MKVQRCAVNLASREEDCGSHITYRPCGKPAEWTVDTGKQEFAACERHAREALLDGDSYEITDADGEPMGMCA